MRPHARYRLQATTSIRLVVRGLVVLPLLVATGSCSWLAGGLIPGWLAGRLAGLVAADRPARAMMSKYFRWVCFSKFLLRSARTQKTKCYIGQITPKP
jgi:hypothetical protein